MTGWRKRQVIEQGTSMTKELPDAARLVMSFLADLNGSNWIKGDNAGEVDMRARSKSLQLLIFQSLAEQPAQQKFVAWMTPDGEECESITHINCDCRPLVYGDISPPQRKPLTDKQIADLYFDNFSMGELKAFARAIEAAHGIKGEA